MHRQKQQRQRQPWLLPMQIPRQISPPSPTTPFPSASASPPGEQAVPECTPLQRPLPPPQQPSLPLSNLTTPRRQTSINIPTIPTPAQLFCHLEPTNATSMPMKVPDPSIWGPQDILVGRKRYGLSKSALPCKLEGELALQRVPKDPQPNLSRVGVCNNQLQPDSFQRHHKNIMRYTGVLPHFLGVEACSLSL
ncbi:hypothetical protein DUNSADRAFT_2785 [Dunaliella salina]|uniref:Encoded protein n=1 Tax=Dunaliella salina TaxID=3046 RepID=A0ABQ7FWD8_DUNSA|nr:hypothetical protein DUNSADRAFT_2785 [Dunaliella salina]|eukprot:KAF5826542.1 hypothetical protein DUNSADRAFT_2785 [Dunaliella salina]